ncbi:MAG: serine/threonine protein kinase [Pirellulaceae bacterium]|nr:serine/threonine protein kinase [Pirellulaceae bacterium]
MTDQFDRHPPKEQLVGFALGTLDSSEAERIADHLDRCRDCCNTMVGLQDDTFLGLVRESPPPGPPSGELGGKAAVAPASPTMDAVAGPSGARSDGREQLPPALRQHPRYEILALIGRGGMGDVYKAQHRVMNRPVALKVIRPELVRSDAAVKRFQREVQAAARLHHANIVTAHDAEQAGSLHFLVMEFVEGVNLDEVIRRRGALPVAEACEIIRQVALGLQHAHEHGMVHRDIKPHNLMATAGRTSSPSSMQKNGGSPDAFPTVKILDFGLSNLASEAAASDMSDENADPKAPGDGEKLTLAGTMMGTPDFIAPEQARDAHAADIRSDIYSLGCTFYTLLTGKPPFPEGSVLEKIKAHAGQAPPPLAEFRDDVPSEVEAILLKMMAKDPAERFQTPVHVSQTLAEYSRLSSKPAARVLEKPAYARRRPLVIAATLLLTLSLALAAVIVVVTDRGRLEIQSEVDDVQVVVKQDGREVHTIDLKTGSQIKWLATGKYELELAGSDNDVKLDQDGFTLHRLGKAIVTARWSSEGQGVIRSFGTSEPTITQDGVDVVDGGWKIAADKTRTVRLFEAPMPQMKPGPFFYRAKLRTEGVKGRSYLEMWVRIPGKGEFFSKGLHNAVSGTNGWAEYEIPFWVTENEQPDLVKLNLTIEDGGVVWIKDMELRGRQTTASQPSDDDSKENTERTTLDGATRVDMVASPPFLIGRLADNLAVWDAVR